MATEDTDMEATHYWQSYGWQREPFSLLLDETMACTLPRYENQFDLLQHLVHYENILIAVIGEDGVGKSTFLNFFINQVKDSVSTAAIKATVSTTPEKIINVIVNDFRLEIPASDFLDERLELLATEIQFQERPCVLVIDNAQYLSKEALQALLFLIQQQSKDQMRFHVILFGNPQLQVHLANVSRQELNADLIHHMDLEPLNCEETKLYLKHRLTTVGHEGDLPFDDLVIEHISQRSKGIPKRVNQIAQQMLQENLLRQKNNTSTNSLMPKIQNKIFGGVVVILLLAGLLWGLDRKESNNFDKPKKAIPLIAFSENENAKDSHKIISQHEKQVEIASKVNQPEPQVKELPKNEPQQQVETQISTNTPNTNSFEDEIIKNTTNVAIKDAGVVSVSNEQPIPNVVAEQDKNPNPNPNANLLKDVAPENPVTNNQANNNTLVLAENKTEMRDLNEQALNGSKASYSETLEKVAAITRSKKEEALEKKNLKNSKKHSLASIETSKLESQDTKESHKNSKKKEVKKELLISKTTTTKKSSKKEPKTEQKLHKPTPVTQHTSRDSRESYTLQIVSAGRESGLKNLVSQYKGKEHISYYRTTLHGKPWYVLICGKYNSKAAAENAKAHLPSHLKQYKPWVRSYAGITDEMKKTN